MTYKQFNYDEDVKITNHFSSNEMQCKCGGHHPFAINIDMIKKVEKLIDILGARMAVISSGMRCPSHDVNVGGNGSGPHTTGDAMDVCFYAQDGSVIDTKLISCIAQDMGFNGIANINSSYTYIHLDMKDRIYRGNEVINYNTVTNDFYEYYGLDKDEIRARYSIQNVDEKDEFAWEYNKDEQIVELQNILNAKGYSLDVDGIAGDKTLEVCRDYTIELNDRGELTKWVQKRLDTIGFPCGDFDGVAGNSTMAAIGKFQKKNALGVGYLGGEDWYFLIK